MALRSFKRLDIGPKKGNVLISLFFFELNIFLSGKCGVGFIKLALRW
jgi:hypothetical protein